MVLFAFSSPAVRSAAEKALHVVCETEGETVWIDNDVLIVSLLNAFGGVGSGGGSAGNVKGKLVLMDCLGKLVIMKVFFLFIS
jgi:hypothetical protein